MAQALTMDRPLRSAGTRRASGVQPLRPQPCVLSHWQKLRGAGVRRRGVRVTESLRDSDQGSIPDMQVSKCRMVMFAKELQLTKAHCHNAPAFQKFTS